MKILEIIQSCRWEGKRIKKLKMFSATAFVVTTSNNIAEAIYLFESRNFELVLLAVLSQDSQKMFFLQAKEGYCGNFYIEIVNVTATEKVQHLRQLIKHSIVLVEDHQKNDFPVCTQEINKNDLDILSNLSIDATQVAFVFHRNVKTYSHIYW